MSITTGSESAAIGVAEGLRPELERIISAGRRHGDLREGSTVSAGLLVLISMVLLWISFTPVEFAPAAWVALVPLTLLIRLDALPRGTYRWLTGLGFLWGLATLQWMRLGHPAMYGALAALALYVGLYFPAFVTISRRLAARGVPVWLAVPCVWTGLEYLRAWLLTGFSWYYLGHSQYRWMALIQISDIVGAYGVSFVVALANAAIAMQITPEFLSRWQLRATRSVVAAPAAPVAWRSAVCAVALVAGCQIYGMLRLRDPSEFGAGPSIALIQGNFTPEVKHDPDSWMQRYAIHNRLTRECSSLRPHIIVWPETMFPWPDQSVAEGVTDEQLMSRLPTGMLQQAGFDAEQVSQIWRSGEVRDVLADHSRTCGAAMLVGIESHMATAGDVVAFNSAAFIRPDIGYVGRYDKMHRVVFGEYVPLKDLFPWLSNLTPFGPNYGISAGREIQIFEYGGFHLAPLICFEDTVPHLVRRIVAARTAANQGCDVLINVTNDAWFRGSSELDQHLITAAFRCVETRTPLVRAVNGGISAFIDGNGEIREPEQILQIDDDAENYRAELKPVTGMRDPSTGRWRRQFSGIVFGQVPLDSRESLYVRWGDWFAGCCLMVSAALTVLSLVRPRLSLGSSR